jgi:homoserine kinase type II
MEHSRQPVSDLAPAAANRVADELLRRYGLGPLLEARVVSAGVLNQNLAAVTARGGFFLKGYRYADPAPIDREHTLIRFVADQGLPAVSPLADPAGRTFLRVGGRLWAVFPLIQDRQLNPGELSAPEAAALGGVLGRLHLALNQVPPALADRFPSKLQWNRPAALRLMTELEVEIRRRPAHDPFDQHTAASFAYRRALFARGVPPSEAFASLPMQLLHGDFHSGNVFFGRQQVTGIVDWELAGPGPRAWEVIRALDLALPLHEDFQTGGERIRAFLSAYAAEAPLSEQEATVMPDLYWSARVHTLWPYEEHYRKGNARSDRTAMQDLATLQWWSSHREELGRLLLETLRASPPARIEVPGAT